MNNDISRADKVKLDILEIIKDYSGFCPLLENSWHGSHKEIKISGNDVYKIMRQNGINWYQLEDLLKIFKQEGLIIKYESINPAM